jgi:FtsH-binding integral membrane protein
MFNQSTYSGTLSHASGESRASFIRKTYLHLALSVLVFAGLQVIYFTTGIAEIFSSIVYSSSIIWFVIIALFIGVSWVANKWALSTTSKGIQYAGLGLYILIESIIFIPLLYVAIFFSGPMLLPTAGFLTLFLFFALSFLVLWTRTDYSFLGSVLAIGGFLALGVIVAGAVFGFNLGLWFSGAMIAFAGAAILYDTSNILHHYHEDQYVAASLSLFASLALLFYYILTFLLQFTNRD